MKLLPRIYLLIIGLCLTSSPSYALSFKTISQQVDAFEQSGQARFAPASIKKVKAYLGASMLAFEQQSSGFTGQKDQQTQALQHAIAQTSKTLEIAKNNANAFTSSFSPLLQLEIEANKAYVYHHKPRMLPEHSVTQYYDDANTWLNKAIITTEQGQLNQARKAAEKASLAFAQCIDQAMPYLVEQTERALSKADNVGARKYAPRLWAIAQAEFGLLERYRDDLQRLTDAKEGVARPTKVGYAYEIAIYAQKIAIQVKDLRRDTGSHEKFTLKARREHLDIAKALALPLDYDKVGLDIEASTLVRHIKNLRKTLLNERKQHQAQIESMKKKFAQELQNKLYQQRSHDQQAFQSKVATIKSAFNNKLEQETFETKRQKKIMGLFKEGEADIIVNIDGSLIIRAKKIQFEPNSSEVAGQYFEFLNRIKEALLMYPERQITLEGHTDSIGDEKVNQKLSLQRAEAVQEFLIVSGIDADRIRTLGFGEIKPIASNKYKKGRNMNRRIDIIIGAAKHG